MSRFVPAHGHAAGSKRPASSTYRTWEGMLRRCTKTSAADYPRYGGRGITIDPSWRVFTGFLADMGERPVGKTLDRIDNDGSYCKDNCRWATADEQRRNTRVNVYLTFNGRTQILSDWACELGLSKDLLSSRLHAGWTTERALTQLPRPLRRLTASEADEVRSAIDADRYGGSRGERTLTAVARRYGISPSTALRIIGCRAIVEVLQ